MNFLEKLDLLMRGKSISRSDLARESGIPYTTIDSFYKKGHENIKLSTLKKLSNYFGVPLDYWADDSVSENDNEKIAPEEVRGDMAKLAETFNLLDGSLPKEKFDLIIKLVKAVIESDI